MSIYRFRFKSMGRKVVIGKPLFITPRFIDIGDEVGIWPNCRIEGVSYYEGVGFNPLITIGDHVSIQQNLHLTCAKSIVIGENTAIAANVTITDIHHPYEDIAVPIEKQKIRVSPVRIGKDCKIYNNAVILPGVNIGKHVTVGANCVVGHDIPDYCVVAGIPGAIIKRYNFSSGQWEKTDKDGNFNINKN